MKYEIENYKGQLIEYDEDHDKFVCDISIEDKFKTTKRLSLKDVKKEIDTFIKLNIDFKPFKCLAIYKYDKDDFTDLNVSAIRTDGKFITFKEGQENYKSHSDKKDALYWRVYDADIIKEKEELEKEKEAVILKYRNAMKELCTKLTPIDLSKYEFSVTESE